MFIPNINAHRMVSLRRARRNCISPKMQLQRSCQRARSWRNTEGSRRERGFALLETSLGVFLALILTFAFFNLMRYVQARNALERAVEIAARCVTPTDGDCNSIDLGGQANGAFDWFGFRPKNEQAWFASMYRYSGWMETEDWQAQGRAYRLFDDRYEASFNRGDVTVIPVAISFSRYQKVRSDFLVDYVEWRQDKKLPRFIDRDERFCHGRDELGNWLPGVRGDISSSLCLENYNRQQGVNFNNAGDVEGLLSNQQNALELYSSWVDVPILRAQLGELQLPAETMSACRDLEGNKCSGQWNALARVALHVSAEVQCLSCGRGSFAELGSQAPDGLVVEMQTPDGRLESTNLGGIQQRAFTSSITPFTFNLRGPDGSHGSSIGCRPGDCGSSYDHIYVPRGGRFRARVRYQTPSKETFRVQAHFRYVLEDYLPQWFSTKVSYNSRFVEELINKCQKEEILQKGRQGVCRLEGQSREDTCEEPASGEAMPAWLEPIPDPALMTRENVVLCSQETLQERIPELARPKKGILCSINPAKSKTFTVGKASLEGCKNIASYRPVRQNYDCGLGEAGQSESSWREQCPDSLAREIAEIERATAQLKKLKVSGLEVHAPEVKLTSKTTERPELSWNPSSKPEASRFEQVIVEGQIKNRMARVDGSKPAISEFVFRWKGDASRRLLPSSNIQAEVELLRINRQPFTKHYPFFSTRPDGFVPPLPDWRQAGKSRCADIYAGQKITSLEDALRFFASREEKAAIARYASGYVYKFGFDVDGPRTDEVKAADVAAWIDTAGGCWEYSVVHRQGLEEKPVFIQRTSQPDQPLLCREQVYRNCYSVATDDASANGYADELETDAQKAERLGLQVLTRFLPVSGRCDLRQANCADIVVDLVTDPTRAKVTASYHMPWIFPLDLLLGPGVYLSEQKREILELSIAQGLE